MPVMMEQFLRYCLTGSFIGIPLVAILWIAKQKYLASIAIFICMTLAGFLVLGFLAGIPELFGLIPMGTLFFPKGYQFQMYPHPIRFHMIWLIWAIVTTLSMYGLWILRKAQAVLEKKSDPKIRLLLFSCFICLCFGCYVVYDRNHRVLNFFVSH